MTLMEGLGAKLLSKMGWSEGTGLGAKRNGVIEPVGIPKRPEKLGIGAERRPFKDAWWEKAMEDAYGKPKEADADALFEACEGRRCRPHGSAKLARLEAHDKQIAGGVAEADGEEAGDDAGKGAEDKKRKRRQKGDDEKRNKKEKKRRKKSAKAELKVEGSIVKKKRKSEKKKYKETESNADIVDAKNEKRSKKSKGMKSAKGT